MAFGDYSVNCFFWCCYHNLRPQEKNNELRLESIKYMIEDDEKVKFNYNFGASSCVPISTYEIAADEIDVEGIKSPLTDCSE